MFACRAALGIAPPMLNRASACARVQFERVTQALSARRRLFNLFFRRAARFLWCRFFVTARSMPDVAWRYASVAAARSLAPTNFRNFLIEVRNDERWLMLRMRHLTLWRARFRAWGELAKIISRFEVGYKGRGDIINFAAKVKHELNMSVVLAIPTRAFPQIPCHPS